MIQRTGDSALAAVADGLARFVPYVEIRALCAAGTRDQTVGALCGRPAAFAPDATGRATFDAVSAACVFSAARAVAGSS